MTSRETPATTERPLIILHDHKLRLQEKRKKGKGKKKKKTPPPPPPTPIDIPALSAPHPPPAPSTSHEPAPDSPRKAQLRRRPRGNIASLPGMAAPRQAETRLQEAAVAARNSSSDANALNRRSRLPLDTAVAPVHQTGCFEVDRVIKSGFVQKRGQKTKVCHL